MQQSSITMLTLGILVVLVLGLYFFTGWFSATTGYVLGEDEKIKLAQCLSGKDIVFYESFTCPKCLEQKEKFGDKATEFLTIVSCASADSCEAEGGVPAWKIGERFYYGVQELIVLSEISNCQIEED